MAKLTRGQKAAATLKSNNPKHFNEIGAEGGKKTPGTFQTKRGLARSAGKRSGQARKLKGLLNKIAAIEAEMPQLDRDDQIQAQAKIVALNEEHRRLRIEYEGGHSVEGLEYIQ